MFSFFTNKTTTISTALILMLTLLTPLVRAETTYRQMSKDYTHLQSGIEDILKNIKNNKDKITASTKSKNQDEDLLGYLITESNIRLTTFRLQALLRLLNNSSFLSDKESKQIKELYKDIKTIEDAIGKMDEAATTLANSVKKGASDKKIKQLRDKADEQAQALAKVYKQAGWFKKDAAKKSISKIDFLSVMSPQEESILIRGQIKKEIQSFQEKIKNEWIPGMRDEVFSHDSMELYFHEFRREIRWISLYFSSSPGIFSLSPYNLENYTLSQKSILEAYKGHKYAEIASENSLYTIDRYAFYNLTHYIELAGDAKDVAEEHFKLLKEKIKSDLDEDQFKNDMVKMMLDFNNSGIFLELLKTID